MLRYCSIKAEYQFASAGSRNPSGEATVGCLVDPICRGCEPVPAGRQAALAKKFQRPQGCPRHMGPGKR